MSNLTFKGYWPDENGEDGNWETFRVQLWGDEDGDMIEDLEEVEATLARAGLKIVRI